MNVLVLIYWDGKKAMRFFPQVRLERKSRMFGYVVLGLLFLWGVLMVAKPELLWSIEHSGQMDRQRPTEKYISTMRIAGSVCMVLAVALLVMLLR